MVPAPRSFQVQLVRDNRPRFIHVDIAALCWKRTRGISPHPLRTTSQCRALDFTLRGA